MTIKDLAEKTGYAVGTVSRALNNHPNVSEKARRSILKAAQESGFELNVNAKLLKQQHFKTVLVITKGIGNELFSHMVETIQAQLAKTPYQLVTDYMDEDANVVLRAAQLCREKKPMGIIFLGGNMADFIQDFDKIDVPCVLATNHADTLDFPNLSSISINNREAAACAIRTLIEAGHRKIAIVGGDRQVSDTSRLRFEGCATVFQEFGIPFDDTRDYRGVRFSCQDGYDATKALLRGSGSYTAIFAVADLMAIGVIRALWEQGLRVPEDVSVIGVDGLPLCSYLVPKLSTISQPLQILAERSVEILLDAMENGASACHETVPFTLQYGESIRKIRQTE